MYKFVAIEDDSFKDPDLLLPATPLFSVPTPVPDGKYNDYEVIAGYDFKDAAVFATPTWSHRSFTAPANYDSLGVDTHVAYATPIPNNTPVGVVFHGADPADGYTSPDDLNHTGAPSYCPNLGGTITDNPATFPYGELDCQVKWHIDKWEGGEMWTATAINISNYQDILVKYYFDASVEVDGTPVPTVECLPTATPAPTAAGISRMPHGFVPYSLYPLPTNAPVFLPPPGSVGDQAFLPYSCCRGLNNQDHLLDGLKASTNCADGCFTEQMLMVMYSTDDTATPDIDFAEMLPENRLVNIRKWSIAEVVPRKVLQRSGGDTVRYLDFARSETLKGKSDLKLWFRFQSDDSNDELHIRQVRVFGIPAQ